jgi:hypothetical protein
LGAESGKDAILQTTCQPIKPRVCVGTTPVWPGLAARRNLASGQSRLHFGICTRPTRQLVFY